MEKTEILIPTCNRVHELSVTLTGLLNQEDDSFDILIADQSNSDELFNNQVIKTIVSLLRKKGHEVRVFKNLPRQGMAQQRQFLLANSQASKVLFLDDDVLLEPFALTIMKEALDKYKCGFVGMGLIGISYSRDERPEEGKVEFWENGVEAETIVPGDERWQRYKLHNAANVLHVQEKMKINRHDPKVYKVAWSGGCVLFDSKKLKDTGGFEFWQELPEKHCGEDVLAQLRVMKKYGGCGILPSGAYHLEVETLIPDRTLNAPQFLKI